MIVNLIHNGIKSYYMQLPVNTGPSICRSALYSFAASFIILKTNSSRATANLTRPLVLSGVAATASLMHALTTPIFNYIFENQDMKWTQETFRFIFTFTMIQLALNHPSSSKINQMITNKKSFYFFSSNLIGIGVELIAKGMGCIDQTYADHFKTWTNTFNLGLTKSSNPTYVAF